MTCSKSHKKKHSAGSGANAPWDLPSHQASFWVGPSPDTHRSKPGKKNNSPNGQAQGNVANNTQNHPAGSCISMRDEAKIMATHVVTATRSCNLRSMPVAFISAGFIEPLKELDKEIVRKADQRKANQRTSQKQQDHAVDGATATSQDHFFMGELQASLAEIALLPENTTTAAKPAGEKPNAVITDNKIEGDDAAEESDSSAEVILFRGRKSRAPLTATATMTKASDVVADVVSKAVGALLDSKAVDEAIDHQHDAPAAADTNSDNESGESQAKVNVDDGLGFKDQRHFGLRARKNDDDDSLLDDYIANMIAEFGDKPLHSHFQMNDRDLGGSENNIQIPSDDSSSIWSYAAELVGDAPFMDDALAVAVAATDKGTHGRKNRGRKDGKSLVKRDGTFPSASAVADAIDKFDLMQCDRQILAQARVARRCKKGPLILDNLDSDLQADLNRAWQKDREKKKQRKLERQARRGQGLLGSQQDIMDPFDLRYKYDKGFSLHELKAELREFLECEAFILRLPPVDPNARQLIHGAAHLLGMTTKSEGQGKSRHPVLYRTKRTPVLNDYDRIIEKSTAKIRRPYFARVDKKNGPHRAGPTGIEKSNGPDPNNPVPVERTAPPRKWRPGNPLTYREGEVVGKFAPELGQDNRGRAMLEKMGWTKGMALGAAHNPGILTPPEHIMKKTKKGLR